MTSPEQASLVELVQSLEQPARLWWRDDDAGPADDRLGRMLELAQDFTVPVLLAVVPAVLDDATVATIRRCKLAEVAQHGWAHRDHARAGAKKTELGGAADRESLLAALAKGRRRLIEAFGAQYQDIMVPPWNRIDDDVAGQLAGMGFSGLSTFADHDVRGVSGLAQLNAHVDAIAWRQERRNLSFDELAGSLSRAIRKHHPSPIGLLTHHLAMDDAGFAALRRLFCLLTLQENILWGGARQYLGSGS